ncbi:MAG: ATP-binding protein, partial [Spirochaetales bacterium]|nr:ATP-binding protein [Spirochaetales bacterium]
MPNIEYVDIEFKELEKETERIPESAIKAVVAFLNTEGGELYIGVCDDGSVCGVADPDDTSKRLSSSIHDAIRPDASPFISIRIEEKEGKHIVKASVIVGTERPYYLAKAGLKPGGVYTRLGNACIPMSEAGIRSLMLETTGTSFEQARSMEQDLSFSTLQEAMAKQHFEFGQAQMETLQLIGRDTLFTNVALLLSDQCTHTCKVAVFQGRDTTLFRDRREFSGSILKQL